MYGSMMKKAGSRESNQDDRPPPYSTSIVPIESVLGAFPTQPLLAAEGGANGQAPLGVDNEAIKLDELPVVPEREKLSFHQAARYGNETVIRKYLSKYRGKRKKINKLDKHEWSALHYAVRHGHLEVIRILIEGKADVNIVGADGAQPIHTAAKYFKADKHMADNVDIPISTDELMSMVADADPDASPLGNLIPDVLPTTDAVGQDGEPEIKAPEKGEEVQEVITYLLRQGADVNCIDNYNQTPLHYAANKGNIEAIALLLSWPGVSLDLTDTAGGIPLHSACSGNAQADAVKLLLTAGSKLMVWNNEHQSPLHIAATAEGGTAIFREIFKVVEERGGEVENYKIPGMLNDQDSHGNTVLHRAVDFGNIKLCRLILGKGAKVNVARDNFATPLHMASSAGDLELVKLLVSYGANIEALNLTSETPLHKAAKHSRTAVIEFLIKQGADIDADEQNNKTPLIMASANNSKESVTSVQTLLANNADLTQIDSSEKTALHWAAEENVIEVMKLLLEKISKSKSLTYLIEATDRFANTALHIASKKGFRPIVNLLIQHGAIVDCVNDEELTPLHLASIKGYHKVANALLAKQGSMINDQDESGNSPLHLAAMNGHVKLIDLLIDYGADTDARNIMLATPLDCAASKGHSECCIRLIERDAEVDSVDLARTTPLHVASREGYADVVEVLLEKGSDVTLLDHEGKNALDMAVDNGHSEVAHIFLNHKDWLLAVKNRTLEGKTIKTPIRRMIERMPDVAYAYLNKCMKLTKDMQIDDENYQVKFFYELIDDTYADWYDDPNAGDDGDNKSVCGASTIGSETMEENANRLTEPIMKIMEQKETHPLIMMCENDCDELLMHPLCLGLIYDKWQRFGRIVFYSKFMLYFVFLLIYTGFVIVSTPLVPRQKMINGSIQCYSRARPEDKKLYKVIFFFFGGRVLLLLLCLFQLLLEIPQILSQKFKYVLDMNNWLEWTIYGSAALYSWPSFSDLLDGSLETLDCNTHISIGSMGIFVAWINLLLFLQKFPMLGIYVVMFLDVSKTFLRFSLVFILFVLSFAIGFYALLQDKFPLTYENIGRTAVKTTVMMIGEFDFDSLFNGGEVTPPLVTWLLFIIFVVVMTILLTNLMVGLAVDDIKAVLDQAVMKRVSMQVNLVIDVEKSLPRKFRQKFMDTEKTIYPNQEFKWYKKLLTSHITTMDEIQQAIKPKKKISTIVREQTNSIRESVNRMKTRSVGMQKQLKGIERMLQKIMKASNIPEDNDDDDDMD